MKREFEMKNATVANLGSRLRVLREEVHMEQEIVARVLEIPRTAVVAFEAGKREVSAMELIQLCKLYRISPNDLLGWHNYRSRARALAHEAER